MLFTIDIGNSNIVIALMKNKDEITFMARTKTIKNGDEEYYYRTISKIFDENNINADEIEGAILSSVVPEITQAVAKAAGEIADTDTILVTYQSETGITICTDNPEKVGNDLIVDAVCGINEYEGDLIIFDMGTATTCSVIDRERNYLGTIIIPGMAISAQALSSKASQLPKIQFKAPKHLIGRNTVESMQSGLIYANAAMIDGLVQRIEKETGREATVLATGGIASIVVPHCQKKITYDPDILTKGLWYIYQNEHKN